MNTLCEIKPTASQGLEECKILYQFLFEERPGWERDGVYGLGFRVQGLGCRVQGSWFGGWSLGFRV